MKLSSKQLTTTAALLAICIISQFFKNTSVFITGPIINVCLILAAISCGLIPGIILAVITPITSFFITGSPIISAIPAIMPCIMVGNSLLVICAYFFYTKIKKKAGLPVGLLCGSVLKSVFMGVVISLILIPTLLPDAMLPKINTFQMMFSVVQLLTSLIGSVLAYIIWIPLKKIYAEQN